MNITLVIVMFVLSVALCNAAWEQITADTVMYLTPGRGQTSGQGPAFFPQNIFGLPDPRANDSTPTTDPRSICSLGLGGVIVVGFSQHVVTDGPGADLSIFENAFRYSQGRIYAEPARVLFSRDGVVWVAYPYNITTLDGCAGKTPPSGSDVFDPTRSGGDVFDLSVVGIDSVRWIRIEDVTDSILSNKQHPYYDPTLTGFDLDAIVSAHGVKAPHVSTLFVQPRSTSIEAHVVGGTGQMHVFNTQGVLLSSESLAPGVHVREMSSYENTCLIVSLLVNNKVFTTKVLQ